MDSLEVAEEIIDQFDDKISGQGALEFIADGSVVKFRLCQGISYFHKNQNLSNSIDQDFM